MQHRAVEVVLVSRSLRVGRLRFKVRGGAASKVDLVVARDSERANALRPVPCVYELNPVAFIP